MSWFTSLRRSQSGSAMPIVALGIFMLVSATGTAVDMGRVQIVQSRLQNALDAAGLAVGSEISTADVPVETKKYFYANFPPEYLGTSITSGPAAIVNSDNTLIKLSVTGKVSMTFMQILGVDEVEVKASSTIKRTSRGLELVLVLDNTGSMLQSAGGTDTKLSAAQKASITLLNIMYGNKNTLTNTWIGIVPFSQAVNIGTANTGWLDATSVANFNYGPVATLASPGHPGTCSPYNTVLGTYAAGPTCTYALPSASAQPNFHMINWQGCVEARANGTLSPQYDITDDTPATKPFKPYLYPVGGSSGTNQNLWYKTSNVSSSCTGGGCAQSHTVPATCTTTYPACCPANAESCTNPLNCGRASTTYACTSTICDVANPAQICTSKNHIYDYSLSTWMGNNKGPNLYCPQPIQPLIAEKDKLITAINGMKAVGETEINLGLAWGWRMLSPRWRGLWGSSMNSNNLPLNYNTPLMTKVVILMTDGDNNMVSGGYSAYGLSTANQLGVTNCTGTNCAVGITALNTRTNTVCTNMKAQGIVIYTIALGTSFNATSQTMLKNCASNPAFYFLSPTTDDLEGVFMKIADSLANLTISQ